MKLSEVLDSNAYVLIEFYDESCPPCQYLSKELIKLKKRLGDNIDIVQVDRKKDLKAFEAFKIKSLPHMKLFKFKKPLWEFSGIKSEKELIFIINKLEKDGQF